MNEARPNPPRRNLFAVWRWKRRWHILLLTLLVLYPLSVGPLVWLHDRQRLPSWASEVLQPVYFPLGVLIFTGWDFGVLKRYVGFWESLP